MNIQSHLKTGRVLNRRYRIDELLATGGFGEVYAAFDRLMERKVALKYIFRRMNVEQLRNEVIILARHAEKLKFIPNVYDHWSGSGNDAGYYIIMEFVEGETLDKCRALPWPSDDVTAFLRILLSNLRDLHSLRIIHCDIKPINIKRAPPDDWSYHVPYRLLDFGIAKQGDETTVPATTPHYAAPEQYHLSGRNTKIDHRTDLYGLAATAYFLLTGKPPIEARIRYSNVFDLQHPDPLRAPSELVNGAPWALEETLLDMLQIDRELRPRTAAEALQILERRLSDRAPDNAGESYNTATELATHSPTAEPAPDLPRLLLTELPARTDGALASAPPTMIPAAPPSPAATPIPPPPPAQPALPAVERQAAPLVEPPEPIETAIAAPPAPARPALIPAAPQRSDRFAEQPAKPPRETPAAGAGKSAVLLDKHGDGLIASIAWSLDSQNLLIGTTLGVYQHRAQGTACELWQPADTPIQHVGIACAGQKVALATDDTVRLINSAGEPAAKLLAAPSQALPGQLLTAAQGNSIAVVTDDGLYIFDPDTDTQTAAWRLAPRLTSRRTALSSDGETVVVVDSGQLWCAALRSDQRGRQWIVGGLPQPLVDLALTPDGRMVAVASPDAIAIWRRGDKHAQPLAYAGERIVKIALSSDGATLAVATGARASLWPTDGAGKPKALAEGELSGIQQVVFSPDDRMLAAATIGEIRLWRTRDGALEQAMPQFGPRGRRLALLAGNNFATLGTALQLWSIEHNQLQPGPALGSAPARTRAVLADARGERIAVAADAALQIWDPAERSLQHAIAALPAQERCLAFASDSGQCLLVAQDSVEAYDIATGDLHRRTALGDPQPIDHIALAPGGQRVAIHSNGRIAVRRLPDGDAMYTIQPRAEREVTAIGFSAEGTYLAVADEARITLWRLDEDAPARLGSAALPEQAPAHHLVFAPDGAALASLHGSVVHLWRVAEETLRYVGTARGHADRVTDAILTPDSARLITASRDGALRLWAVPD